MTITQLHYTSTNTYLISGSKGILLFDTGWAGTFRAFCREMGEIGIPVQKISYILISHFHPDHCGNAQEISETGPVIAVMDLQRGYVHAADKFLQREPEKGFRPIDDNRLRVVEMKNSRSFLQEMGIEGEILATPGHSDDSISLCLDDGSFFVGDLNPLYELEMHRGTTIGESWEMLLSRHPKAVYYGHAPAVRLGDPGAQPGYPAVKLGDAAAQQDRQQDPGRPAGRDAAREYALVKRIMRYTDKGCSAEWIQKKTGLELGWIKDVMRMYLTHPQVSVQGILDRMEIRGR